MNGVNSGILEYNLGVPLGSVLATTLFNLFINDTADEIKYCKLELYAADILIYLEANNIYELGSKVQSDVNNIVNWTVENKMKININKTKCLIM